MPHQRKDKPHPNRKYFTKEVAGWRRLLKDNRWTQVDLASHLGITIKTVGAVLARDARGELE